MTLDDPGAPRRQTTRGGRLRLALAALVAIAVAAGALGLYVGRPPGKNMAARSGACARSLDLAQAIEPLIHGEVAALTAATQPNALESVAFDKDDGSKTTVGAFKGKTILLNLWATWCVPCRAEMPSLDKLQAGQASAGFSIIPVDVDTTRLDKARGFFKEIGATHLPYYSDSSADILHAMPHGTPITGLPTSILVGPDSCEIATMAGPADWNSAEAKALIEKLKGGAS